MKQMKNRYFCVILVALCLLFSGCQQAPSSNVVISKNDGAFDTNVVQSASENSNTEGTQNIEYSDVFFSTDGTVEFRMEIDDEIRNGGMPVVEVIPHYLSEEDVKRVAEVLFESAEYYEAQPALDEIYTQDEILEKITRWSQYTSVPALRELYGDKNNLQDTVDLIKRFIDSYTKMYEVAPTDGIKEPCRWEYIKDSYYQYAEEKIDPKDIENDNDTIAATIRVGDVQYYFNASTRDRADFKLNYINMFLYGGTSPDAIDTKIFRALLCRTDEPTEEQLDAIKAKAEDMLIQMELGEWLVDECYVEVTYYGDTPEYIICVNAVPVINGVPAIRLPQLSNLKSEEAYASNYYLTDVNMEFSAHGELVSFKMYSPIDIKNVVNSNALVMSVDELIDIAKNNLMLSDYYDYGFGSFADMTSEEVGCTISITNLAYNLARVKVPDTDTSYYYVPGIMLKGDVVYYGKESGIVYLARKDVILVSLNGIDGSVVHTRNS